MSRRTLFPSPLVGPLWERVARRDSGETGEGSSLRVQLSFECAEITPHPALRATFSRKARRKKLRCLLP